MAGRASQGRSRNAAVLVPFFNRSPSFLSACAVYVIRKRLTLPAEQALFLFVGGTLPTTSTLLRELYSSYADADGFLYCHYSSENTFGAGGGGDEREERRASRGEESEDKEIETASSR